MKNNCKKDTNIKLNVQEEGVILSNKKKTLVLFVFHVVNERVENFFKYCIFYDENVDFYVISNGKKNVFHVPPYVKILYRDNKGYDFGGWSEALLLDNLYLNYDHFVFINSSAVGPFLPSYYKERWTDVYTNELQNNVKLFGSTINTSRDPLHFSHVQSYVFAMDKITLKFLIECEIFSITKYSKTLKDAIWDKEIAMSRKIIDNGWNISCLLRYYKNIDFTFSEKKPQDYDTNFLAGDLMYEKYRGCLWNETELVFVKGNRIPITFKK